MIKRNKYTNWILVYILLFLSGSYLCKLSQEMYLIVGFLIAFTAWYLYSDRKINDQFLLYTIVFSSFFFLLMLYTGDSISLQSVISMIIKLVIGYLILRTVRANFLETYIKVVVFLAVFSLFGFLVDSFDLFDGLIRKLPPVDDKGYEGIFYLYRYYYHPDRNNSIFFEPGAYQAFLNAGLFLLFFTKTGFKKSAKLSYIAILLITLITTFSTTGYVIFLVMFPLFLFRSDILTFTGKAILIGAIVVVVSALSVQLYSAFVVKLSDYLTAEDPYETGRSAVTRSSDYKIDLKIFKKHIFGLGHEKYLEENRKIGRREKAGSSNGVTSTLAKYGLPFSLFLFGSYFWALRKLLDDHLLAIVAFVMFMLFLAGESFYVLAPVSLAIIAGAFVFDRTSVKTNGSSLTQVGRLE